MAKKFLVWIIVGLFAVSATGQSSLPIDPFYRTHQDIVNDWGTCHVFLAEKEQNNISPYGPAYWDDFLACWEGTGIADDFRKYEVHIRQIALQIQKVREQQP
jgi:hypothetical protein